MAIKVNMLTTMLTTFLSGGGRGGLQQQEASPFPLPTPMIV